jgi:hypothetical protein
MLSRLFNSRYIFYYFTILLFVHLFDKAAQAGLELGTKFIVTLAIIAIIWWLGKVADVVEQKMKKNKLKNNKK